MSEEAVPVRIPLLNPNEPEALVAALHVKEGQHISPGDLLCTLETTKSTAELSAEAAGYVAGLAFAAGQSARAGELLCYLAPAPDWQPPTAAPAAPQGESLPPDLRITGPALALARQHNLDLSSLPRGALLTEKQVRGLLGEVKSPAILLPERSFEPNAIIVYGGGGHGKTLIDLLHSLGNYPIAGVVDDGLAPGELVLDIPVLGGAAVFVFELNSRYDIDGDFPWNTARFINHSCSPNCEVRIARGRIWIVSRRKIRAGEELTYDYGYDFESFEEHPCRCGSRGCVGYIVRTGLRRRLKKVLGEKAVGRRD